MAGGTNGLNSTLDHVIDLKKAVSLDNADTDQYHFFSLNLSLIEDDFK